MTWQDGCGMIFVAEDGFLSAGMGRSGMMLHIRKRCCEIAALLCCLFLLFNYGKSGAKVMPLTGDGIRAAGFSGKNYILTDIVNNEWDITKTAVDEAIAQGRYDALLAAREEKQRKEVMVENEERFYEAAWQMELNQDAICGV